MESTESPENTCKHQRLPRNCYLCYMHRHEYEPTRKTPMDALHETISELKIRITKLEQYSRLQADHNTLQREINLTLDNHIKELNEHRKKQIDENRAVAKHFDDLDGWREALDNDLGSAHEKIIKLETMNQRAIDANPIKDIYERFAEIDRQLKNQGDINVVLLDKFKSVIKDEIIKTKEDMVATSLKTTGLSFEEAIVAFKAGKKIRRSKIHVDDFFIDAKSYEVKSEKSAIDGCSMIELEDFFATDWMVID